MNERNRRALQGTTQRFFIHFAGRGYTVREPEPLVPRNDPSLLFNNSAIVNLKPHLREAGPFTTPFSVIQPCLRTHILEHPGPRSAPEYMGYFHMCGVFAPPERYSEFVRDFVSYLDLEAVLERTRIHAASDQETLIEPLQRNGTVPLVFDTFPDDYYRWKFGMGGIRGEGLTIAIADPHGGWRDIGNIIEVIRDGKLFAYGLGFGLETFLSRIFNRPQPIYCSRINKFVPETDNPSIRYADLLQMALVMYRHGIRPGQTSRSRILARILRELLQMIEYLDVPFHTCAQALKGFEAEEFGNVSGVHKLLIVDLKMISL